MMRAPRFGIRSLSVLLVMTALAAALSAGGVRPSPALAARYVDCRDARWYVGMNVRNLRPAGDVVRVEAIRRIAAPAAPRRDGVIFPRYTLGYRYTLRDRRIYVADRGRAAVTLESLATMNEIVNRMAEFQGIAFDPRDDGNRAYQVDWNPAAAKDLRLELAPCPARPMRG